MIDKVLHLLKDKLNIYFKIKANTSEETVRFLDGNKTDPISFPNNAVVPLLINIEEERTLRPPDRFEGIVKNGIRTENNPDIRLNLLVLFVANFNDYEQSLKFLSLAIKYFQFNRTFDQHNTPTLDPEIGRFKLELITLPLSGQNELWNSLRTTYLPSVLYKISMIAFRDDQSVEPAFKAEETKIEVSQL